MRLIAWNSQGNKWDICWSNWLAPALGNNEDVVGVLVESGWAPWVSPGEVTIDCPYPVDKDTTWYNHRVAANSAFCTGINARRGRHGMWVPWIKNFNALKVNTRCSLGATFLPHKRIIKSMTSFKSELCSRPVLKLSFGKVDEIDITILVVHLISGYPRYAQEQLNELTASMRARIPQGTCGIIVGDMNINLLTTNVVAPDNWRILRTGLRTQASGGELDWAILYDPARRYGGANAAVLRRYHSHHPPVNPSDHSVISYHIPLP